MKNITRRDFLKGTIAGAAAAAFTAIPGVAYADRTGILSEEKTYEEGQYSFEIPPEKVPESEINETIDVDLCIVGASQAGTLAAPPAAIRSICTRAHWMNCFRPTSRSPSAVRCRTGIFIRAISRP